jgi:lipopolysaccharide transport system ATP-binding protein
MSDFAIKVENLSKQYRLGKVGTGTLSHDLNRLWHTIRGKEDPYIKIGQANDRTKKANSDYVWALQDINFEVKKGEVLGIIGRNGAGKSTLLKILSKITAPTTGQITVNGRIASLLEVGTGFHPELSGRENIFLNGAILGMRKWEIQKKFDEIVDFAGVEAYIDTPVKRYSSGMYVRLAFAVAAFLEPEILIVDEVLAVGDAEFQKKCLGRMKDVSVNDGRTVLFVSHNMAAIQNLCNVCLLLDNGRVSKVGITDVVINQYNSKQLKLNNIEPNSGNSVYLKNIFFYKNGEKNHSISTGSHAVIEVQVISKINISNIVIGVGINDQYGSRIMTPFSKYSDKFYDLIIGNNNIICEIPFFSLKPGIYNVEIYIGRGNDTLDYYDKGIVLNIESVEKGIINYLPTATQGYFIINQIWR